VVVTGLVVCTGFGAVGSSRLLACLEIQVNWTTGSEAHCLYGLGCVSMVLKLPDALPFLTYPARNYRKIPGDSLLISSIVWNKSRRTYLGGVEQIYLYLGYRKLARLQGIIQSTGNGPGY